MDLSGEDLQVKGSRLAYYIGGCGMTGDTHLEELGQLIDALDESNIDMELGESEEDAFNQGRFGGCKVTTSTSSTIL